MRSRPKVIVDPYFRQLHEIFSASDREWLNALPEAEMVICGGWEN